MICSWNKLVSVILILFKMTPLIRCFCDWLHTPYFTVYHANLGSGFILDVNAYNQPFTWRKDGRPLAVKNCNNANDPNCTRIYTLTPNPDLRFKKIKLEDSGKYILELNCYYRRVYSFEVIVQDKPFVYIDCNDMTVYEGDNISCICKVIDDSVSPAAVAWNRTKLVRGNSEEENVTDILTLENLSRHQSGTYTCFDKSHKTSSSFNLRVVPKRTAITTARAQIKYFKVFQEVQICYSKLILICKAEGIPEPRCVITHNGTVVKYGNMYVVDTGNISSLGEYECFAKNRVDSDRRLLFLNSSFIANLCLDEDKVMYKGEIVWKIGFIVGVCSFLAGFLVLYVLICSYKKFTQKNNRYENSGYDDVSPRSAQEGLAPTSEIEEIRLHHTSSGPGNEVVRHSEECELPVIVGNRSNHVYCNESSYQELSEYREKDEERYQSLNPIDA